MARSDGAVLDEHEISCCRIGRSAFFLRNMQSPRGATNASDSLFGMWSDKGCKLMRRSPTRQRQQARLDVRLMEHVII